MSINTIQGYYDAEITAGTIPMVTQAIYNRSLLERAEPLLVYDKFGQRHPLKTRSGKSMVFRRWLNLDENTSPLTEGVTPAGSALTKEEVIATIKQYGDYVTITDMLDLTNFDPIINEASEILGEQMGQSLDTIYGNYLTAGTNAWAATADGTVAAYGARTATAYPIQKIALDKVINLLDRANAKKFTRMVSGADKDNTWPLAASYWGVIHPDVTRDLYNATSDMTLGQDFTPVEQYSNHVQVMKGEVGKYRSIRFIESTHTKIWEGAGATSTSYRNDGSALDVYGCLFFARDAYGIIPLEKGSARTIVHRAGSNVDPLNQRNTVGWKAATTLAILNDDYMVRLEVASNL